MRRNAEPEPRTAKVLENELPEARERVKGHACARRLPRLNSSRKERRQQGRQTSESKKLLAAAMMRRRTSIFVVLCAAATAACGATTRKQGLVAWGNPLMGANISAIAGEFPCGSLAQISCASTACAFLRQDGVVKTSGATLLGGDVGVLADDLFDVKELVAGDFTFGALRTDGSALHWGYGPYGGDVGGLQNLQNVSKIFGGRQARAALFANGTLVCWGNRFAGGDCAAMKETFARKDMGLRKLVAHANAFAALSETGQVFVWGNPYFGGILPSEDLGRQLESNVIDVAHTETAFAAIKANGTVVIWGGLESLSGPTKLNLGSSFKAVYATRNTFIFVTTENELITIGAIDSLLVSDVEHVAAGRTAFTVLHVNGSVSSYGIASPESSTLTSQLSSDVIEIIVSGGDAFAAIKADRTLVTWGNAARGGDHSAVAEQVASAGGVAAVWANDYSFVAKLADEKGTLVAWGDGNFGGDASAVASHLAEGHIIDVVGGVDFWIVAKACAPSAAPSDASDIPSDASSEAISSLAPTTQSPTRGPESITEHGEDVPVDATIDDSSSVPTTSNLLTDSPSTSIATAMPTMIIPSSSPAPSAAFTFVATQSPSQHSSAGLLTQTPTLLPTRDPTLSMPISNITSSAPTTSPEHEATMSPATHNLGSGSASPSVPTSSPSLHLTSAMPTSAPSVVTTSTQPPSELVQGSPTRSPFSTRTPAGETFSGAPKGAVIGVTVILGALVTLAAAIAGFISLRRKRSRRNMVVPEERLPSRKFAFGSD